MSILLQPCSGKQAMNHFEDTVVNGVPLSYFTNKINNEDFIKLKELNNDLIKVWGFVPNSKVKEWERLKEGDIVLFSKDKGFFYMAIVHSKIHNKEVSDSLWGVDDQGRNWEYMYFIKEGKSIQMPYDPTILIKDNSLSYSPDHRIQGAQLLTGENYNSMKKYLEEKEGSDFDENVVEPTEEDEVKFYNKIIEPLTVEEAEAEIKKISIEIKDSPVKEKIKIAKMLVRNPKFARLVKERVKYVCEICGADPFVQKGGGLYAEAHHKSELAKTKIDNPNDMICVCPTCHRILHYGSENELLKKIELKSRNI